MYILCDQLNIDRNMHIMGILCTYYVISSMISIDGSMHIMCILCTYYAISSVISCSPFYCSLFSVGGGGAGVSGWGGLLLVFSATSHGKGTTAPASLANSCE